MEIDLAAVVEELGAVLAAPDTPLRRRYEQPGIDKKWKAGDIAAHLSKSDLKLVASKLDFPPALLRSYADVARAYPPEQRTVRAAWTTYRELRKLPPERRALLLRDGQKMRPAREAIGKGPVDRKKKERLSDEERAWFVVGELQEPGIRAIVEKEMNSSSADRKARKAAKTTMDEIAAKRKFIDSELRKQAKQGTPDRQYWEASKELLNAEQFIYSIARLHHRHADAMSGERWTEIVTKLGHLADSALEASRSIEGLASGDYVDAEVVGDRHALPAGRGELGGYRRR